MSVYVDTSALYAMLDADDDNHMAARDAWTDLLSGEEELLCSNYVLVELFALVQHRLGLAATRALQEEVVPVLSVHWVNEAVHEAGVAALLIAGQARLSLVDCVSFGLMRALGIRTTFTLDRHFQEQGFSCVPKQPQR